MWFGVDIGGTSVKAAIVDDGGRLVAQQAIPTEAGRGPADLCLRLRETLRGMADACGMDPGVIRGAGVGVPAFLDLARGVVVEAINLGWREVPLAELLADVLGMPVSVDNDANLAALGEAWAGAGAGAHTVLCTTVGTGVGGGVVIGGRLHHGANGMAGEIGHMRVVREGGLLCNCGQTGCLETVASATAIVREARERQAAGMLPPDERIDGAADVARLARDHEAARRVLETAGRWLGFGLAQAAVVLNPDVIVIGGGVSKAGDLLLEPARAAFTESAQRLVAEATLLRLAKLGNGAGVVGAARLAMQRA
ncbi:ROK family protein [Alicyclobacillus macrosporangiidus]|uniref:Glucokinase n=1 Tax=Alicyclobacillus macrosporangiidus TaxID=392015 RepID=A0A1I7K1N7_9BACL|nr:ROK family glucokinase [Alicyclobacillus macrosporangiidus]SFU91344.1 glucokinase [Alicyclobacillus macrosporangiidus]